MAEQQADDTGRLEAALERIARAASSAGEVRPHGDIATAMPEAAALAARLDALITELRSILGQN